MKTLKIIDKLHYDIKKYCNDNGLKLNTWAEKQLEIKLKEFLDVCVKKDQSDR
jgi:hypothetical protein